MFTLAANGDRIDCAKTWRPGTVTIDFRSPTMPKRIDNGFGHRYNVKLKFILIVQIRHSNRNKIGPD